MNNIATKPICTAKPLSSTSYETVYQLTLEDPQIQVPVVPVIRHKTVLRRCYRRTVKPI